MFILCAQVMASSPTVHSTSGAARGEADVLGNPGGVVCRLDAGMLTLNPGGVVCRLDAGVLTERCCIEGCCALPKVDDELELVTSRCRR